MSWQVRYAGTSTAVRAESPQRVIEGLRSGEWDVTDEVRGPDDSAWRPIEDHPRFEEFAADIAPPRVEPPDETRLDMNPLIDVALVLLIFFIITTTYATLRRSINVPSEPDDKSGQAAAKVRPEDLKDVAFAVTVWMDGTTPRIRVEDKIVDAADVERAIADQVRSSGRRQLILSVEGKVPWGIEAAVHDAAKAADVNHIYRRKYVPPVP